MRANSDKTKGKAKQLDGKVTGDSVHQMQGASADTKGDVKGDIKGAVGSAVSRVKAGVTRTKAKIQRGVSKARASTGPRSRGR